MPDLAVNMDILKKTIDTLDYELPMEDFDSDKNARYANVLYTVHMAKSEPWNVACFVEQQHRPDNSIG
jgi:hypothetical protein